MKKLKYLLISLLVLIPIKVSAANGSIVVSGPNQVLVGNNVTYTVTLTANGALGYWDMLLNYDTSMLQLVSTTNDMGGTRMMDTGDGKAKVVYYTYTFRTLKSGNATVSIGSYDIVDFDEKNISVTNSSKTTKVITQAQLEASYSKDNNLRALSVEGFEISPEFNKDTLEYSVTVPEDTKSINIIATRNDNTATVSGAGSHEVTEGNNKFEIVVRAQNGAEKTYTLSVEVIDKNPIDVKVNGKSYSVVKIATNLEKPNGYEEKTIKISDTDIPAFYSDVTKYTLVGLKDSEGNIGLFIYNNGEYEKYIELKLGNVVIYPLEMKEKIKGYDKTTIKINDETVECLSSKDDDRFKLIYGININTNEKGLFLYDSKDNSAIKYNESLMSSLNNKILILTCCVVLFGVVALFALVLLLVVSKKKKGNVEKPKKEKKQKKAQEEVATEEIETNEKIEESEIDSMLNEDDMKLVDDVPPRKKEKNKKKKKEIKEETDEDTTYDIFSD